MVIRFFAFIILVRYYFSILNTLFECYFIFKYLNTYLEYFFCGFLVGGCIPNTFNNYLFKIGKITQI